RVVAPGAIDAMFDAAVDRHQARRVWPLDLPRRSERQPVVGLLRLAPVVDLLSKQAVLVVDAVPVTGHVEGGQRVQEARRQSAETAVPKRGITLRLGDVG